VDPLTSKYPKWSPYAFSGNQVIHSVELEGLETENDIDPSEDAKKIGTPQDDDGHLIRDYKLNPYNSSKSFLTFTTGQQMWHPGRKPPNEGDASVEAGGFGSKRGVIGLATNGTKFYNTDIRGIDELSESNHSFGVMFTVSQRFMDRYLKFMSGRIAFGALYTKQKIRGNDPTGYNYEAPASLTYNLSYRIGFGQRNFNWGITSGIGVGQMIATLRIPEVKNDLGEIVQEKWTSNIKNIGSSYGALLKVDISYRHFGYYVQGMATRFVASAQGTSIGVKPGRKYAIGMVTVGVIYSVHLKNISR